MKASLYYWRDTQYREQSANHWADLNDDFRVSAVVNNPSASRHRHIPSLERRVNSTNTLQVCIAQNL